MALLKQSNKHKMSLDFEIDGKNLYYKGQLFLSISNPIKDVLFIDGFIILLLEYSPFVNDRNIVGYSFEKEFLWQIAEPDKFHDVNYYTCLYLRDNRLHAYNINGVEVTIKPSSGEILDRQLIK